MLEWIFNENMPNKLFWVLAGIRHFITNNTSRHIVYINGYTNKEECYFCKDQFEGNFKKEKKKND